MFLKVIEFIIKIQQIALDSHLESSKNFVSASLFLFDTTFFYQTLLVPISGGKYRLKVVGIKLNLKLWDQESNRVESRKE